MFSNSSFEGRLFNCCTTASRVNEFLRNRSNIEVGKLNNFNFRAQVTCSSGKKVTLSFSCAIDCVDSWAKNKEFWGEWLEVLDDGSFSFDRVIWTSREELNDELNKFCSER